MSKEMAGLKEATLGPSEHDCPGVLVDATISRQRIVLVCYTCNTYWHTALSDDEIFSVAALIRASDKLYELPQYKRSRCLREQRERLAEKTYNLYRRGMSCSQLAERYGVSRQTIHERLKRRGYELRPVHDVLHEKIEWHGNIYTPSHSKGYYRRTSEPRTMLHRDIWEHHHGPIPNGYQVGHKDGNFHNNALDNLICLPTDDMTRFHNPRQKPPEKYCLACGARLVRKLRPGGSIEPPSALEKRQYCDRKCARQRFVTEERGEQYAGAD